MAVILPYCILNKRELHLCERESNTLSSAIRSWYRVEKSVVQCFPSLQKRCVIVAIHTEINQQEETPKFKIWAISDMPQSRNNTKWESINVLPLGSIFQSELIIRRCLALLCLKELWDQLIPHSLMLSHLQMVVSFPKIHDILFVPTWASYYC